MTDSILSSIKKVLGLVETDTAFDADIIFHINSVLATLNELGIGPDDGFAVEDASADWTDFLGDNPKLNSVKNYIYLRVRLLFDPPSTGYALDAMKQQIEELTWRLNTVREATAWVDPRPPIDEEAL